MSTLIDKLKGEIIEWMNYGIPRGTTVPVFEDMVDEFARQVAEETKKELVMEFERLSDEIPEAYGYRIYSKNVKVILRKKCKELTPPTPLTDDKE